MNSPTLTAQFQLENADLNAFKRFLDGNKSGASILQKVKVPLILLLVILGATVFFKTQLPPVPSVPVRPVPQTSLWLSTILPVGLVIVFWGFIFTNNRARRNAPILVNPSTVTLSDEDFRVEFGVTAISTQWKGVPRVEQTQTHVFLFTEARDGFIVPHRAFDSDEEFQQFCDFARHHQQAAQPNPPEPPPIARA